MYLLGNNLATKFLIVSRHSNTDIQLRSVRIRVSKPPRLLPAGATVAGRDYHPLEFGTPYHGALVHHIMPSTLAP